MSNFLCFRPNLPKYDSLKSVTSRGSLKIGANLKRKFSTPKITRKLSPPKLIRMLSTPILRRKISKKLTKIEVTSVEADLDFGNFQGPYCEQAVLERARIASQNRKFRKLEIRKKIIIPPNRHF